MQPIKTLTRSRTKRMLGGVAGGLGDFLGIDPTVVRLAFVIIALLGYVLPAVLIYLVMLVVVPEEPAEGQPIPASWTPPANPAGTRDVPISNAAPEAPAAPAGDPPVAADFPPEQPGE